MVFEVGVGAALQRLFALCCSSMLTRTVNYAQLQAKRLLSITCCLPRHFLHFHLFDKDNHDARSQMVLGTGVFSTRGPHQIQHEVLPAESQQGKHCVLCIQRASARMPQKSNTKSPTIAFRASRHHGIKSRNRF